MQSSQTSAPSAGNGLRLHGKVAIVTGSATGIGRACAKAMAAAGAAVTIDYVGAADPAQQAVAEIEQAGGKAIAVEADVTQQDHMQHLIDETVRHFGRLDIMQNNAGFEQKHPFLDMPFDIFQRVIAINLT